MYDGQRQRPKGTAAPYFGGCSIENEKGRLDLSPINHSGERVL
jgi:hypothetical protein